MRLCRRLGLKGLAWALRRLHCPVGQEALVLEVGSGENPYPRANVLLDAYEETRQRHWAPLKVDRPLVVGFIENLPFKTGSFDFLIASHVLEHSLYPAKALNEFQRVAQAGYIEVPDAFFERLNPYKDHRCEITLRQGVLWIRKKPFWVLDQDLVELYEDRVKASFTKDFMRHDPFIFHVRYYWNDKVRFQIINPETDSTWDPPKDDAVSCPHPGRQRGGRALVVDALRYLWSQNRRNRQIDLRELLICPACGSEKLKSEANFLQCRACKAQYEVRSKVPIMYPE
ncbi:MAG: methyltransferase domain-containing protein [Deltaproteobacteria bacterium]